MKRLVFALAITILSSGLAHAQQASYDHSPVVSEEGLGRAHMETSCSPTVAAEFDRSLALLHNFGTRVLSSASVKSQRMIPSARWRTGVRR